MNSRRGVSGLIAVPAIALVVAFLLPTTGRAGDDDFALSKLAVPGDILSLVPVDLDADSLQDIVIFHRKGVHPNQSRWVSVFWQAANGTFGTAPDQSWEIDTLATVADVGNVDGHDGVEICYLTSHDVRYYQLDGRRFSDASTMLFPCTSLTVFPSRDQIPVSDFVRDWDGHPGDEVAVFDFTGLDIYRADAGHQYSPGSAMRIELQTSLGTSEESTERDRITGVHATFQFPDITIADWNGDGYTDLIATLDDRLQIYTQNSDGTFDAEPAARIDFDVRTLEEKEDGESELNTVVADLNRDSYADAIVTKLTAKGISNIRSVISLFWGRAEGYPAVPDQVMVSEGSVSAAMNLRDVNGDGNLDMILPSLRISITAIIRMLITRNIPITFNIFLYQEGQKYSDRPDFEKEVKFEIDFSGESDTQAMTLDGDFDGDGVKDFVLATGDDELSIYLGDEANPKELFSKRAVSKVEVDAFGQLIAEDLNNDNFSDMILHYPNTDDMKGFVEVLMNRRTIE